MIDSQNKPKKKFEPFPVRSIRASDKVWKEIQNKRGSMSWNKFLSGVEYIDNKL